MDNIILTPVPLDVLLQSMRAIIKEEIKADYLKSLEEKLLTTGEVKKLFGVSTVTIGSWSDQGLLKRYSIGGRNFYKNSEVMDSLKTLKKYKHS